MKKCASLVTFLALAFASHMPVHAEQLASSTQQAPKLAVMQARMFGPVQMFSLTADLFTRSYFADLRAAPNWGPDHPAWAQSLSAFSSEMVQLLLPKGTDLDSYLSAELQRQLTPEELSDLAASVSQPEFTKAADRLTVIGASWRNLVLVHTVMRAPTFYSSAEREQAKAVVSTLRDRVSAESGSLLKDDLKPLADFLDSSVFAKYKAALGNTFMGGAKRLGETLEGKRDFESLMRRWHAKLKQGA